MPDSTVIAQIVETMRKLAGPHPGFRPVHAKGIVCAGTFRPSPDAQRVSKAAHLQGAAVSATIRFANASGNPGIADGASGVRSMAVKLQLPDGKQTDILGNSVEGFVASTPEQMLEFLRAQLPDPATGKPDPQAVRAPVSS
jgi:catalase